MAASDVTDTFTIIRLVDISGGFTPDPDWRETNDVAGWRANSSPHTWHPNYQRGGSAGVPHFMVLFYDNASTVIPAGNFTRVDIELVANVTVEDGLVASRLVRRGFERRIPGDDILDEGESLAFQEQLGTRIVAAQGLPNANFLAVLGRIS